MDVKGYEDRPLRSSDEIQGNILAGFRKDHQAFLMVHFANADSGRAWLRWLAPHIATTRQVTAFNDWFAANRRLQPDGSLLDPDLEERRRTWIGIVSGGTSSPLVDPENSQVLAVWLNIGFTRDGLVALDPSLVSDLEGYEAFRENYVAFRAGPFVRAHGLQDDLPEEWRFSDRTEPALHAILTVATEDAQDLARAVAAIKTQMRQFSEVDIPHAECGATLPGSRRGEEHFGFRDGISQPPVRGFDVSDAAADPTSTRVGSDRPIAAGEFVFGYPNSSGRQRPAPSWMKDGSFQVFRRLAQDVKGWHEQVERLRNAAAMGGPVPSSDAVAASLIGRWKSGASLAQKPDADPGNAGAAGLSNNFSYQNDDNGFETPRFAHIRKVYPRDHDRLGDDRRRLIRRGIPFGPAYDREDPAAGDNDQPRGLLFNAFMASIEEQFEFVMASWASNPRFPGSRTVRGVLDGPDPVVGKDSAPGAMRREGQPDAHLQFERFVHAEGGLYAFVPSLTTLRQRLAQELP
jgi:Dyp-type peroxidase family